MRCIPLVNHPGYAIIDDADYERVMTRRWRINRDGYAEAHTPFALLHRFILEPRSDEEMDHLNGQALDNRRQNLRLCNTWQNKANRRKARVGRGGGPPTSRFKGVHRRKVGSKPWAATIRSRGVCRYLGYFGTEEEAAIAYDAAAREVFGAFARPNFVHPSTL